MTATIPTERVPGRRKDSITSSSPPAIVPGMVFTGGGDYSFLNCTREPIYIVNSSGAITNTFQPSSLEIQISECLDHQTGIIGFSEMTIVEDWRIGELRKKNPKLSYIVSREVAILGRDHLYCYPYSQTRTGVNGHPAYYGLAVLAQR